MAAALEAKDYDSAQAVVDQAAEPLKKRLQRTLDRSKGEAQGNSEFCLDFVLTVYNLALSCLLAWLCLGFVLAFPHLNQKRMCTEVARVGKGYRLPLCRLGWLKKRRKKYKSQNLNTDFTLRLTNNPSHSC